ncbi:MAG: hypothetical protein PHQ08_00675 [Candidatus Pacebacteria bacterium]|nr:hypothetical protein [Candidatus Paceibacterota bacterium]
MTTLRGGLEGNNRFSLDLETVAKKAASQKEISLRFPKKSVSSKEGMDSKELSSYVNDIAQGAYEWISTVAQPFLRELEQDMVEIGQEVCLDRCSDGEETRQERQVDYESTIYALRRFSPQNDGILRNEAEISGRGAFVEALCKRVRQTTEVAILVDEIICSEDKKSLEAILSEAKDGLGKDSNKVFLSSSDKESDFRAFGKPYKVAESAFGRHRDFAVQKLSEAVVSRSREIASAFKAEVQKQKQEVSAVVETDVSPEELFFGDDVEGKTARLVWRYQGRYQNVIRVRRQGDRLYVLDVVGPGPEEALKEMKKRHSEPHILLRSVLHSDGEHLCPSKGGSHYLFGMYIKEDYILAMARWIRTAAGFCMPNRLHSDDKEKSSENGNGNSPLEDADGKEAVSAEVFYFRKNGGGGTIQIVLPVDFVLSLPEVKNEDMDVVAPERKVSLTSPATITVRRTVVKGEPRIVVDECDSEEAKKELCLNGVVGPAWQDDPKKKGWQGLPAPLPSILAFGYKQATLSGELKPNKKN